MTDWDEEARRLVERMEASCVAVEQAPPRFTPRALEFLAVHLRSLGSRLEVEQAKQAAPEVEQVEGVDLGALCDVEVALDQQRIPWQPVRISTWVGGPPR